MTQEQIDRHLEITDLLMEYAGVEFETGETFLASEMVWGAVSHYLKSVAKYRGWPNERHQDLIDVATDLAYETDNPVRVLYLHRSVGSMHTNFYEDWLSDVAVGKGLQDAEELIARLESRTRPPMESRPSQQRRRWFD